jgi:hypothetical protein
MTLERSNFSKGKKLTIIFSIIGGLVIVGGLATFFVLSVAKTKLNGTLQVDGSTFMTEGCRSGSIFGFGGIQLNDGNNRRIRVIADPSSGATRVAFFNSSQTTGEDLGPCAKLEINPQMSTVNGTKNQQGSVTFSCTTGQHKISGTMQFKNCH